VHVLSTKDTCQRTSKDNSGGTPSKHDSKLGSLGFESIPSVQVRGLYAVSFPILDTQGRALAALTVPYAERIDQNQRKSIPEVTAALGLAARAVSSKVGGTVKGSPYV
jgi:hypothetical protein